MLPKKKSNTGDCDCCEKTQQELVERKGMKMCPSCLSINDAAVARQSAIDVIEKSHEVDSAIELKSDIFNSETVSFVELKAAIDNNPDIPAEEKEYALVKEATIRRAVIHKTMVAQKQELLQTQNAHFAWDKNIKDTVVKLRADYREKFKQFDLTYQPVTPKSTKPKAVKSAKSYDRVAVNEAAVKYGVPTNAIQSIIISRPGITADAAGKEMAKILGLPTGDL